jgi:hypothetical protein
MDGVDLPGAGTESPEPTVQGLKYLKQVFRLFQPLAQVGTERDVAGNRRLLFSHYASLILLSLFDPALQSVRKLSDTSALQRVRKRIGGGRVSVGSFSESARVFDPAQLEPVIEELLEALPDGHPGPGPRRRIPETIPEELARRLTMVDGSALRALPQIVAAAGAPGTSGKWRLHLQFQLVRGTPSDVQLTPDGLADGQERDVLEDTLAAGKVYVGDRGYERYRLYESIVTAGSDYVIRGQSRPVETLEERPLSSEARKARVISDEIVKLGQSHGVGAVTHPVRRVIIAGRGAGRLRTDRSTSDQIVLMTSLVDVPAEVVAAIYELRWAIELFFRFLKHLLGCGHLLSHKDQGVAIQVYCALIACLLLAQATGGNLGTRALCLIRLYLSGWADEEEVLAGLARIRASEEARKNRRS